MQKGPACPKCQHSFGVKYREQRGPSRQPLLLKCSHAFCETCLTKLAREEKKGVTCPTCKTVTNLEPGEKISKKLANHYYLTGYLMCSQNSMLQQELNRLTSMTMTQVKRKDKVAEKTGRVCSECRLNKATCKCVKCDCVMCGLCYDKVWTCRYPLHPRYKQVHSLSNSLKQHQATRITDDDNCPFEDVSPLCRLHGKPIEYFCDDDDVAICSRCVIMGDHKEHSITSMEEKNRVFLNDMEPALQFATQVVKKLAKADKILSESVPSVKSETTSAIESIRTHFQGLHADLQTRETELIDQVYQVYQEGISPVVSMKEDLLEEKRNLEQAIRAAQRVMNNNNEVILNAKDILDSLNRAKDVMCVVANTEPDGQTGICFKESCSLADSIKTYGCVQGEVPKRVMFHTLNEAPEDLLSDTTDTASVVSCDSYTSGTGTGAPSTADTGEDVIIEDVMVEGEEEKSKYFLKPMPGRAKMQGHCETVVVTHIRNPRQFYVQRSALDGRLNKMSKAINTWCKGLSTFNDIPVDVQKDDFVLCEYSADKNWYRGRVLSVMTSIETNQNERVVQKHVEVLFFDYGNHETVSIDKLRKMEKRFMKHPEFLMECSLHDIEPSVKDGVWTLEAASTMQKMIADRPMLMTVIREVGNVLEVDLHKPSSDDILDDRPVSVRDGLVFLELASFVTSVDRSVKTGIPSQKRRDFMKPEPRLKGDVFEAQISYMGVPSSFCVQPVGDELDYLGTMINEMQEVYSDGAALYTIFCPQIDMICVAQCQVNDFWYRARVCDLPGNKMVDVQYVDHGGFERIPYQRIRKILDPFLRVPPLAMQCELSDVEPTESEGSWGVECLEWWNDLTSSLNFKVKILEVQVDAMEVILYRILEDTADTFSVNYQLVANGYAKSTGVGSTVLGPPKKEPSEAPKHFTYRENKKDKQQKSSEIAVSYMSTSPVDFVEGPSSTTSSVSTTPLQTPAQTPVETPAQTPIQTPASSKPSTPAVSPTKKVSRPKLITNKNNSTKVSLAQVSAPASPEKNEPESPSAHVEVLVSAFASPANFHLQIAKAEGPSALMANIQQQFKGSKPTNKAWKAKDFCAAQRPQNHLFYRARIQEAFEDGTFLVYFVDFGFEETLTADHLRPLDVKMRAQSCFAIRCYLANIQSTGSSDPLHWSATACEFVMNEIKDKTLYIKKEGDVEDAERGVPIDLLIEESVAETALEPCRTNVYSLIDKMKQEGLAIPCRRKRPSREVETHIESFDSQPFIECPVQSYIKRGAPDCSQFVVIPTYIDCRAIIYCQVVEDEEALNKVTDELQATYMESAPQRVDWQEGQACVSFFTTDDLWNRATVTNVEDMKATVQYLDYGNSETLDLKLLRIPEQQFIDTPQICYECVLHNIIPLTEDGKWTLQVLDYIHSIIVNHHCAIEIMKAEEGCPLEVRMTLPDGSDLGRTLIQMGTATKPDDLTSEYDVSHKISHVLQKGFPFKRPILCPMDEFFPVVITHIELPNVIWFQHVPQEACHIDEDVVKRVIRVNEDLSQLVKMSADLSQTEVVGKTFIKVPAAGQMCSAKFSFDNCWYRGLVIDRDEETQSALILFVDYGNAEYVSLDNLRVLTASARSLAVQGVRCQLFGLQPPGGDTEIWSKHSMTMILELLRDKELLACIKTSDPVSVELYQRVGEEEEELALAYLPLLESGLAQLDPSISEESELADLAVTGVLKENDLEPDVIVETHAAEMMDVGNVRE